jgi:hypothetical protein
MWNKRKTQGIVLAAAGVVLARIDSIVSIVINPMPLLIAKAIGIAAALTGIAIYAGGMPRELKKAKGCPYCFTKNDADAAVCRRCKKSLGKPL